MGEMGNLKEGLRWYLVQEDIQNEYFLSVEYEMIHQNQLNSFVPMQLRREDGRKVLLYDVTNDEALEEIDQNTMNFSFCERLLRAIRQVLLESEEYMLQIEHIKFSKDRIYVEKDGGIRFLYCPDETFAVEQEVEELFAWMLARIDYEDKKCVELAYYVYNEIRKNGVSKHKIQELLQKAEELKKSEKQKTVPVREPISMKEEPIALRELPEPRLSAQKLSEPKLSAPKQKVFSNEKKIERWGLLAGNVMSCLWTLYFLSIGWHYGFSRTVCRYMIAGVLVCFLCFFLQRNIKKQEEKQRAKEIKKKQKPKQKEEAKDSLEFLDEETRILSVQDMPEFWDK